MEEEWCGVLWRENFGCGDFQFMVGGSVVLMGVLEKYILEDDKFSQALLVSHVNNGKDFQKIVNCVLYAWEKSMGGCFAVLFYAMKINGWIVTNTFDSTGHVSFEFAHKKYTGGMVVTGVHLKSRGEFSAMFS